MTGPKTKGKATESKMSSTKNKKDIPWLDDDNAPATESKKSKKARKKIRRKSMGGGGYDPDQSSSSLKSDADSKVHHDEKSRMSLRTIETERSSSHSENLETSFLPEGMKPKKKKGNVIEIDGQLWRCDNHGNPIKRVRKKRDTDDSSYISMSSRSTASKKSIKSKSASRKKGSASARNLDSPSKKEQQKDTSQKSRPRPRRSMSQPELSVEALPGMKVNKPTSGLDLLMRQSVHEHVRKQPDPGQKKPKLDKQKSTLGKLLKIGKSPGKMGKAIKNLKRTGSSDKADASTKSDGSMRSMRSLPPDVKEIDGVMWRVDEHGNKLEKVRYGQGFSSDEEGPSCRSIRSFASSDSMSRRNLGPQQRRNSGSCSSFNHDSFESNGSRRRLASHDGCVNDDGLLPNRSNHSVHTYNAPVNPMRKNQRQPMPRRYSGDHVQTRRKSMDHARYVNPNSETHNSIVNNLQHRLKASEREVARLCKVSLDQGAKMDENRHELRKTRAKLQNANSEKEYLRVEIDKLRHRLKDGGGDDEKYTSELQELRKLKVTLEDKLENEKSRGKSRLEAKEEEVAFLQEELKRMRSEQGERDFQNMRMKSSGSADDDDDVSVASSIASNMLERPRSSMKLVGKMLGSSQRNIDDKVHRQQEVIKDLKKKVSNLQDSNEKLKKELRKATLEIKEDDDEEVRMAKEAAAQAAKYAAKGKKPKPQSLALRDKVLSLSQKHRSGENPNSPLSPTSFRLSRSSHGF